MATAKKICILGSTGSIGTQTLDIVERNPESYRVISLTAGRNLELLRKQIRQFRPSFVSVLNEADVPAIAREFPELQLSFGEKGNLDAVAFGDCDVVVVGIVGFAALAPTLQAVRLKKRIALANKESLVVAGHLLKAEAKVSQAEIIPVDSEHSALFQLLEKTPAAHVRSIVLTASGGPFFRSQISLEEVTPELAVKHPNWNMGPKISVDSATLMNKGLEIIEAHFLFEYPSEQIEVWIHPQSIVHGAVWLKDNSCLAHFGKPNMKSPIGYALGYPNRLPDSIPKLSLKEFSNLEFFEPDEVRFPCLRLARQALQSGARHLVALNAGNEIAVEAFLKKKISFTAIPKVLTRLMDVTVPTLKLSLEEVFEADSKARGAATEIVESLLLPS